MNVRRIIRHKDSLPAVIMGDHGLRARHDRTPDTVWQLLSQLSDFIGIKNRHCELW
jgi:hypothetical protein